MGMRTSSCVSLDFSADDGRWRPPARNIVALARCHRPTAQTSRLSYARSQRQGGGRDHGTSDRVGHTKGSARLPASRGLITLCPDDVDKEIERLGGKLSRDKKTKPHAPIRRRRVAMLIRTALSWLGVFYRSNIARTDHHRR